MTTVVILEIAEPEDTLGTRGKGAPSEARVTPLRRVRLTRRALVARFGQRGEHLAEVLVDPEINLAHPLTITAAPPRGEGPGQTGPRRVMPSWRGAGIQKAAATVLGGSAGRRAR